MKRVLPFLLAAALLATACGAQASSQEPEAQLDTQQASVPEQPEPAPEQAGQETPSPPVEENDSVFDGLDLTTLDLLGDIVSTQENAFTFTPIAVEEHGESAYASGMVSFENQPTETIHYTPETEWGWVLYDIQNNTTRLDVAEPEDMQAGMTAYIWGTEQEDGFVANRVMLLQAE